MPWLSRYPLPARVAPPLTLPQPVTAQQLERYVHNEAELRSAIGEMAAHFSVDSNAVRTEFGGTIIVAASFTVKAPVSVVTRCTIDGSRGGVIYAGAASLSSLFVIEAELVTIRDLFVRALNGKFFTSLAEAKGANSWLRIQNCYTETDRLFVDGAAGGDAAESWFVDNVVISQSATFSAPIELQSPRCVVRGNRLADGGGDAITLQGGASDTEVTGNYCSFADITSNGSRNVIMGNRRTGTITRHVTDAVDNNT